MTAVAARQAFENVGLNNDMIRSMTGYGQGSGEIGEVRITVTLRSLNNRFADLRLKLPSELAGWEAALRRRCQKVIRRGRLEVAVTVDRPGSGQVPGLNRPLIQAAVAAAKELEEDFGIRGTLDLRTALSLPGIFQTAATDEPVLGDDERAAVESTLDRALQAIDGERRREGEALRDDLLERIDHMRSLLDELRDRAAEIPARVRQKLLERMATLAEDVDLDPARVAQEVALLADRADITEELVRLEAHLDRMRSLLSEPDGDPVGKRLDFLVQELHRETNTIGSKASDLEASRLALALKADTEKVREQVQNLE